MGENICEKKSENPVKNVLFMKKYAIMLEGIFCRKETFKRCVMKRKLAIVLAGAMTCMVALTGCGSKNDASNEYVTIKGYKGVEVDAVDDASEVTDEDVENYIESVLAQNAEEESITDRAVQEGDIAVINFVGKIDGAEFDGGSAEDYSLEIGSDSFIDGFEDSIIGHSIGETFDWNGQFPEDYNEELGGKDVVFTITVNEIKVENVPELTDDFVKTVSEESETVKEYKKEVKALLEENAASDSSYELQNAAWNAVMELAEVEKYPEGKVEDLTDSLIEQYTTMAEYYGMDYETFVTEQMGYTVEEFEEKAKEAAEESVKMQLVAQAIAEAEKLVPSDKEYQEKYEEMCEEYGYDDVDALIEAAGSEEDLQAIVLENIVMEWLADNCVQVKE